MIEFEPSLESAWVPSTLSDMGLHVLGQRCPVCRKRGLVIGADDGVTFRPQGWLVRRLAAREIACPHCGAVMVALLPESVKRLNEALRAERETETVTYHARRGGRKKQPKPRPPPAKDS